MQHAAVCSVMEHMTTAMCILAKELENDFVTAMVCPLSLVRSLSRIPREAADSDSPAHTCLSDAHGPTYIS